MKPYKTLEKNFTINKNSIELFIEVFVDGKKIIERKSDSLVGNFLKAIYAHMGGRLTMPETRMVNYNAISGNDNATTITTIDATGSDVVVHTATNIGSEGHLQLSGVETTSGTQLSGIWEYTRSGSSGNFQYTLLGSGSGGSYTNNGGFIQSVSPPPGADDIVPGNWIMNSPAVVLSTSTDAIGVDDYFIEDQIRMSTDGGANSLDAGDVSVTAPFADDTSSIFTISQTFTNLSDAIISIRKAGLFINLPVDAGGDGHTGLLIAEDFVSADLEATETISINYKIRNSTTSDGGILEQFNDILYTLMAGSSQNTRDVFGTNRPEWPQGIGASMPFIACSMGADNHIPFYKFDDNWRIGPVLGSANRSVKSTDHTLLDASDVDSVIQHGEGAGQFYLYGAIVDDWQEDPIAGTAKFTISRFFENRSGGNVTVRQLGLNSAVFSQQSTNISRYIFCLSSNTLIADEIFEPGDVGRVNIVLSVEV